MKIKYFFILLIPVAMLFSCSGKSESKAAFEIEVNNPALENILKSYAYRDFSETAVNDNDINKILLCGSQAPSARNNQPWHFTVSKNIEINKSLISNIKENNIIIIVSGLKNYSSGPVELDCGLAVQNIYLAAQALGLAARIYTGPVENINKKFLQTLEIPDNYQAVAVIRIGHKPAQVDAVSSASGRKNLNNIVNYKN